MLGCLECRITERGGGEYKGLVVIRLEKLKGQQADMHVHIVCGVSLSF